MKLIILLLILLTSLGVWEMARHTLHLRRIPIRIHVNGSRGKSSVARLITAGLRAGGLKVFGKTTGSAAAIIHVDGSESRVRRRGGPNIREQLGVIRKAKRENCDALVIECMAVRPDLQRICEHSIVKATHGVITNMRPDHLEVMGPTMDDVAASLAGTVPSHSALFAAEDCYADFLSQRAKRARSSFHNCTADQVDDSDLTRFSYVEFPENVSLALAVCESAGIDRQTALQGMWEVTPDVGAMTRWRYLESMGENDPRRIKNVEFINGFAANDPESYIRIWKRLNLNDNPDNVIILMNIRGDRQRRSKDLAPLFGKELKAGHYVLVGEETALFRDLLRRGGIPASQISDLSRLDAEDLWRQLVVLSPECCSVIGVGNIAGIGNRLLAHLRKREMAA